ncbi:MAG: FAD/NAD(P)-binding domain-containing protein [Steroidobacteraceae bacterium]
MEPRQELGGGVAYSTRDPSHRLNVPASRMTVLSSEPGAFGAWFEASGGLEDDPDALLTDGRVYPRRSAFGKYVGGLLRAAAASPDAAEFEHIQELAVAVTRRSDGAFDVTLNCGTIFPADIVVLAVSHPLPAVPAALRGLEAHPKLVANPWAAHALADIERDDRVLIIGTALTAIDVIASLRAQGHQGTVLAISRHGLVPRLRGVTPLQPFGDFSGRPSRTARGLLREIREATTQAEACGSNWAAVADALRNQGQTVWSALPPTERRRLLRHLLPFWNVHRYQVAPQLAAVTQTQCAQGSLAIRAARLLSAAFAEGKFRVGLRCRDAGLLEQRFEAIVICTGPAYGSVIASNPVLTGLAGAGLIHADEFDLGLATDGRARALDATGHAQPDMFVAGPLARARFGELMGLPEVSWHAAFVANEIETALSRLLDPLQTG